MRCSAPGEFLHVFWFVRNIGEASPWGGAAGECLSEPGPSLRHRVLLDPSAAVPVMHHSGQSQSRMQSAFFLKWGRGKCDVNETETEAGHCVCTQAVRQNSDKSYQCKGLWEH